ncbi:Zn-dependent hydrolase [Brochothrix thermosphacta]|uniref:ribonuclease J n=1 Tax=Brochothrix thermosphacta TaxID=2756 RepID=UPI00083F5D0E|nr:ribonuclease J [Brochothrix thermosphacta]ODJ47757.1 Zn-dependent hydrolase [Brochothrix thermosphacta]ODJ61758.1 Zn-dependent hydrolase [Brochothrix thermosphacta]
MTIKIVENIKILSLGGVAELGKNMYVVEVNDDIFILDAGLRFPEDELLGIDVVIPDIKYLEENQDRIKAVFLSHGHEDAIGALPYLLKKINNIPVYGTELTVALARAAIKEHKDLKYNRFHVVHARSRLSFEQINVSFFATTHSIPDSIGTVLHTADGAIVYTGDFKFDQSSLPGYQTDLGQIAKIGEKGVLALLSDSSEAEHPGYTSSDSVAAQEMLKGFKKASGRIIVAVVASNVSRLQQVFDAASATNRRVAILGKELERVITVSAKLEKLVIDNEERIVPLKDIEDVADDNLVIIESGHLGEPILQLNKMAKQTHRLVNVRPGDTVFIGATNNPATETLLAKTVDLIYRNDAAVSTFSKDIFISGHASQEELKMMMNLLKPKYFVPIHGEYRMLIEHTKVARSIGFTNEQIFIINKGDILEYKEGRFAMGSRVFSGNTLIDGLGVGDVGNIVLRDRKLLSEDGIFIVVVTISRRQKRIISGPEMMSRGFIYMRESEALIESATKMAEKIVLETLEDKNFEWANLKQAIRDKLNRYLFEQTRRRPMILPVIMEVN